MNIQPFPSESLGIRTNHHHQRLDTSRPTPNLTQPLSLPAMPNPPPDPEFVLRGHTAEITCLAFAVAENRAGDELLLVGWALHRFPR